MIEEGKTLRDVDKPFFNYWKALYHSFYDNELYVDVGKRWKGLCLGYLLFVIFIMSLPFTTRLISEFLPFFDEAIIQPIKDLPTLYIQDGKISTNVEMPYFVKNKRNQVVAIVDTTGTITAMDDKYPDLTILITKEKFFYRYPTAHFFFTPAAQKDQASNIYVYPFTGNSNSAFDGKEWVKQSGIMKLKYFFSILLYPTMAIVAFGSFLVLILTIALMGQFIAKLFFKVSLRYAQSCRLLVVSMTPFMVVFWSVLALGYFSSIYGFILPIFVIFYFCYAVISLKRESQKVVHA
ncbi:hypothetical protein BN59_03381 [Legionella massiliensis]|uniref:DUF1189 domain-containing protein n=1 Tax=Legionella massiliensis TaxID=1034943 RepID=A0A078KXD0_9GAMM|nr:DUF1189 family protein [Legionella massiliensis]CDZ79065.1 hypothetical protein BN59_03381 [Legionella massiliensis]CEE14803.1 hypothetical protein BN1094_03381 [Legionella massiliensis]